MGSGHDWTEASTYSKLGESIEGHEYKIYIGWIDSGMGCKFKGDWGAAHRVQVSLLIENNTVVDRWTKDTILGDA